MTLGKEPFAKERVAAQEVHDKPLELLGELLFCDIAVGEEALPDADVSELVQRCAPIGALI